MVDASVYLCGYWSRDEEKEILHLWRWLAKVLLVS